MNLSIFLIALITDIAFKLPKVVRRLLYKLMPNFGKLVLGHKVWSPEIEDFSEAFLVSGLLKKVIPDPKKMAVIGPSDPLRSGIAWNTTRLIEALSLKSEFDFFQSPVVKLEKEFRSEVFPFFIFKAVQEFKSYDKILLIVGNGNHYQESLNELYRESRSEITVLLHDVIITGVDTKTDSDSEKVNFLYGLEKLPIATKKVLVHSEFAAKMVKNSFSQAGKEVSVEVIEMGVPIEFVFQQSRVKPQMHVIGTAGFFDHSKQPMLTLKTFILIAKKESSAIFEWLGEMDPAMEAIYLSIWKKAGLSHSRLRFLGYQSESKFRETLQNWTCAIQLRKHSNGESSGVVLELAANGTPSVITNIGSFVELSDELFFKASPTEDPREILVLVDKLLSLAPDKWSNLSDQLRTEARNHSFDRYSDEILDRMWC